MALGSSDVSISKKPRRLSRSLRILIVLTGLMSISLVGSLDMAIGAEEQKSGPLHWSGDKTLYNNAENRVELIGHAAVHQLKESLYADHITLELDGKLVHATGNATYVNKDTVIQASEMHFNLETRTGTIVSGRISTPNFTLSGERINKLGQDRFQTHRGEYTTCKDCPASWSLFAEDVDMEIEGYAKLSGVKVKVMDAPALWIPYMIVPLKTKRQTGLLFPKIGRSRFGFTFVQPFFWAISDQTDMTFGLGSFEGQGRRLEWQGRYALRDGEGVFDFYHVNDSTFRDKLGRLGFDNKGFKSSRWALTVAQKQNLPFGIEEKLRVVDISDSAYTADHPFDIAPNQEAFLQSDLSFTHSTDRVSTFLSARRYRNLLTKDTSDPRIFDSNVVQVFPQFQLTTKDRVLFDGSLVSGMNLNISNFVRMGGPSWDQDTVTVGTPGSQTMRPGIDPIREATRIAVNPSLYTTLRPWDVVTVVPSVSHHQYFYDFHGAARSLTRGYTQFKADVSTQFEKIYDASGENIEKTKHLIRPLLQYSLIPYRHEPNHPFTEQIKYARRNNFTGYNFDNEDILPLDASLNNANYFVPQGHSITYGFTTQAIRKRKADRLGLPGYDRPAEWSVGQSYNFRELKKDGVVEKKQPYSRIYSLLNINFDQFGAFFDYFYIPYQPIEEGRSRHVYSTGFTWTLEKGVRQGILDFERSLGMSYYFNRSSSQSQSQTYQANFKFSINDYIMPSARAAYDLINSRWLSADTLVSFQSPSQCWRLDLGLTQALCPDQGSTGRDWCRAVKFTFGWNLTGSGFGGLTDPVGLGGAGSRN